MSGDGVAGHESATTTEELDELGITAEEVALAAEVRRLGDAVLARAIPPSEQVDLAVQLAAINERLAQHPRVPKVEKSYRNNRVATYLATGDWPDPPPNGSRIHFDPGSLVGGSANPFGMGTRFYREGDEAVGFVNLGACFEGPPNRVHGGVVCAVFDEVMGSVFRATGTASAFTGELTVRLEAPAPLNTELEFRARQVEVKGRRRIVKGEARSPEGQFASASGIFIEMKPEHFPTFPDESSKSA